MFFRIGLVLAFPLHSPGRRSTRVNALAVSTTEKLLELHHWSDELFNFKTTRGPGLRFDNGQFVMLALQRAFTESLSLERKAAV